MASASAASICLRRGLFASFSEHFACRADGKLEIYGVLDGSSGQHRVRAEWIANYAPVASELVPLRLSPSNPCASGMLSNPFGPYVHAFDWASNRVAGGALGQRLGFMRPSI
jgi:hypothetical protein